jgi:glycosyltransferase involved in cell wall biosynthesis
MQTTSTQNAAGTQNTNTAAGNAQHKYDMVVFCHLRWDFVYQRPQHIISRMAKDMKVLMIEEPWHRPEEKESRLTVVNNNLHILQPNVTSIEEIQTVLPQYISNKNISIGWFYSASFVPLLNQFEFGTVVYDCMDELSLFKGAPEKLIEQEKYLIANADVVFTGGKSLYESKSQHHSNVHCFPSSVDQKHFEKALNGVAIPQDFAGIKGPVVGYFGVIDERIDYDLINEVALLKPDVSFVMLGPFAKVNEDELPRQQNLHYLGMKDYADLPAYLKGFDIAMMPFALNDATKYISPTKTLEYMAAGKPIISTAIKDVVRDYKSCVKIVATAEEFVQAIDSILMDTPDVFMNYEYAEILKNTSWDATAGKMKTLIKTTVKI